VSLEKELIEAAKFKPMSQHDRQDHLAALARASNKLTDDQFDKLSDEAANWVSSAIKALNAKDEIEEFEDAEPESEEPDEAGDDAASESGDDEAAGADDNDSADADPEDDAEAESENEAAEAAADAKAAKGNNKNKHKVPMAANTAKKAKGKEPEEAPKKKERITVTRYDNIDGSKQMYVKGCTTTEIKEQLGGRYYNILKILEERGHRVERFPGGKFLVTHREDVEAKKRSKKP
jgi:hypothetical protein